MSQNFKMFTILTDSMEQKPSCNLNQIVALLVTGKELPRHA
jgi:hypothetical protein